MIIRALIRTLLRKPFPSASNERRRLIEEVERNWERHLTWMVKKQIGWRPPSC